MVRRILLVIAALGGVVFAVHFRATAEQPRDPAPSVEQAQPDVDGRCRGGCAFEVAYVQGGSQKTCCGEISRVTDDHVLLLIRTETGVPLLSSIPYVSRLFKNTGCQLIAIPRKAIESIRAVEGPGENVEICVMQHVVPAAATACAAGQGCDEPAVPACCSATACPAGTCPVGNCPAGTGPAGNCAAGTCEARATMGITQFRPFVFQTGGGVPGQQIGVDFDVDCVCSNQCESPENAAEPGGSAHVLRFVPAQLPTVSSDAVPAQVSMQQFLEVSVRAARLESQLAATNQLVQMYESLAEEKAKNAKLESQLEAAGQLLEIHESLLSQRAEQAADHAKLTAAVEAQEALLAQYQKHVAEITELTVQNAKIKAELDQARLMAQFEARQASNPRPWALVEPRPDPLHMVAETIVRPEPTCSVPPSLPDIQTTTPRYEAQVEGCGERCTGASREVQATLQLLEEVRQLVERLNRTESAQRPEPQQEILPSPRDLPVR